MMQYLILKGLVLLTHFVELSVLLVEIPEATEMVGYSRGIAKMNSMLKSGRVDDEDPSFLRGYQRMKTLIEAVGEKDKTKNNITAQSYVIKTAIKKSASRVNKIFHKIQSYGNTNPRTSKTINSTVQRNSSTDNQNNSQSSTIKDKDNAPSSETYPTEREGRIVNIDGNIRNYGPSGVMDYAVYDDHEYYDTLDIDLNIGAGLEEDHYYPACDGNDIDLGFLCLDLGIDLELELEFDFGSDETEYAEYYYDGEYENYLTAEADLEIRYLSFYVSYPQLLFQRLPMIFRISLPSAQSAA